MRTSSLLASNLVVMVQDAIVMIWSRRDDHVPRKPPDVIRLDGTRKGICVVRRWASRFPPPSLPGHLVNIIVSKYEYHEQITEKVY